MRCSPPLWPLAAPRLAARRRSPAPVGVIPPRAVGRSRAGAPSRSLEGPRSTSRSTAVHHARPSGNARPAPPCAQCPELVRSRAAGGTATSSPSSSSASPWSCCRRRPPPPRPSVPDVRRRPWRRRSPTAAHPLRSSLHCDSAVLCACVRVCGEVQCQVQSAKCKV